MKIAPTGLDLRLVFVIGLSLSLLGGSGSILTIPALVYLVEQSALADAQVGSSAIGNRGPIRIAIFVVIEAW